MTLYDATRDLHHACEAHPLGQAMVSGSITPPQWAQWLWAMRVLHQVVDAALPDHMERHGALTADLAALPKPCASRAAMRFALDLIGQDTTGAAYVLHGAHCSGGRVLAPKMAKRGLPTAHTSYRDADAVRAWLGGVRGQEQYADQARATFACLLAVMDEITGGADAA
jgi:heme oxygenase